MQPLFSQISHLFTTEATNSLNINELQNNMPSRQLFLDVFNLQSTALNTAKFATLPRSELPQFNLEGNLPTTATSNIILSDNLYVNEEPLSSEYLQESILDTHKGVIQNNTDDSLPINHPSLLINATQQPQSTSSTDTHRLANQNIIDDGNILKQKIERPLQTQTTENKLVANTEETTQFNNTDTKTLNSRPSLGPTEEFAISEANVRQIRVHHPQVKPSATNISDSLEVSSYPNNLNKSNVQPNEKDVSLLDEVKQYQVNNQDKILTGLHIDKTKYTDDNTRILTDLRFEKISQQTNIDKKDLSNTPPVFQDLKSFSVSSVTTTSAEYVFEPKLKQNSNQTQPIQSINPSNLQLTEDNVSLLSQLSPDKKPGGGLEPNHSHHFLRNDTNKINYDEDIVRSFGENNPISKLKSELTSDIQFIQKATELSYETKPNLTNQIVPDKNILPNGLTTVSSTQFSSPLSLDKPALNLTSSNELNNGNVLTQQIIWAKQTNTNQLRLSIAPEHLGSVEINIEHDIDGVNVQFVTQHSSAKEAIEMFMPRLREMLEQNGLNLQNTSVTQQNDQKSSFSEFDNSGNQQLNAQSDANAEDSLKDNHSVRNHYSDSSNSQQYLLEAFA